MHINHTLSKYKVEITQRKRGEIIPISPWTDSQQRQELRESKQKYDTYFISYLDTKPTTPPRPGWASYGELPGHMQKKHRHRPTNQLTL